MKKVHGFRVYLFVMITCALALASSLSYAQCSNNMDGTPGQAGDIEYFSSVPIMRYCDGTNWIDMVDEDNAQAAPITDLVGHWRLDETSGTFIDYSGFNNDGTANGSINYAQAGAVNNAAGFAGGSEYINVPHDPSLTPSNDQTFTFWVRTNEDWDTESNNLWFLLDKQQDAGVFDDNPGARIFVNGFLNEQLIFRIGDGSSNESFGSNFNEWEVNRWYHIAVVYEQNGTAPSVSFYRDGVFDRTESKTGPFTPDWGSADLQIGDGISNGDLNGLMDDVRIYNRALTAGEIEELYNLNTFTPGLVGHWTFDETTGTTAADSSGNGYNGTMTGGMDAGSDTITGPVGTAFVFDGSNDDIEILDGWSAPFEENFSISFWINPVELGGTRDIIGTYDGFGGNDVAIRYSVTSDYMRLEMGSSTFNYNITPADFFGQWNHFVYTRDTSGNGQLYENGVVVATTSSLPTGTYNLTQNDFFTLGDRAIGNDQYMGGMDDVRVYNKVLSNSEVQELYNLNTLTQGLVGHWLLDETSGTFADSSGNNNTGTQSGGVSYAQTGIINNGVGFDGVDDRITVSDPVLTQAESANGFTYSSWVKVNTGSAYGRFMERNFDNLFMNYSANDGGSLLCGLRDTSSNFYDVNTPAIALDTWYHVACTYNGSNLQTIYLNGVAVDTEDATAFDTFQNSGTDFGIGNRPNSGGNDFSGELDDVRVYNYALSSAEIQALYNEGNIQTGNCPNIGDMCDDGTIFAGISPDGDQRMYTTPSDQTTAPGVSWDAQGFPYSATGFTNVNAGATLQANAEAYFTLSNYPAFELCSNLSLGGHNDWYLPALEELNVLYTNHVAIGNFITTPATAADTAYWSSTDPSNFDDYAAGIRFDNGGYRTSNGGSVGKGDTNHVRCVRKDTDALAGVVGHWRFEETSGTTVYDSSGQGNNGTMTGSMDAGNDTAAGLIGNAFDFDGTDDNIDVTDPGDLYQTLPLTISGWFNMDQLPSVAGNDFHIARRRQASAPWYAWTAYVDDPSDTVVFELRDSTTNYRLDGNAILVPGQWHHWAATIDSSNNAILYIDGIAQDDTETMAGSIYQSTGSELVIGTSNGATQAPFDGRLDELRIHSRALSASEVADLYESGGRELGLIGHWRLNETSATTTATDSSGFGNNGTMTSMSGSANTVSSPVNSTGLNFDNSSPSDYITIPDSDLFDNVASTNELTVSIWTNKQSDQAGYRALLHRQRTAGSGNNESWGLYYHVNDTYSFIWRTDTASNVFDTGVDANADIGQWVHFAATTDGSTVRVYRNGIEIGSSFFSGTYESNDTVVSIGTGYNSGAPSTGEMTDAYLSDARVYNRAFSAEEIGDLYEQGGRELGLVGHWRLDETTGTNAVDSSGNGNDGNMFNGLTASSHSTTGIINNALDFGNSATHEIEVPPDSAIADIFSGGGTISFWTYLNSHTNNQDFVYKTSNSGTLPEGYIISTLGTNGRLLLRHAWQTGRHEWRADNTLNLNSWNHVLVTFDDSVDTNEPTLYLNGVQTGVTLWYDIGGGGAPQPSDASETLWLGYGVDGLMDDIRFYNRILTEDEALELYAQSGQELGLVGHWQLDESGNTSVAVNTVSPGTNDGDLRDFPADPSAEWVSGVAGNSLDFSGANNYSINAGSDAAFDIAEGTVSLWFITPNATAGNRHIFSKDESGANAGDFTLQIRGPGAGADAYKLRFYTESPTANSVHSDTVISANVWTHVVMTFGASGKRMYVDGVLQAQTSAATDGMTNTTPNLIIGNLREANTQGFDGRVDDVRVYNYALSASQVRELYNTPTLPESDLVAHWQFDETTGTTAFDSTGNGNDGQMQAGLSGTNDSIDGPVNTALDFDGTDDYVSIVNPGSPDLDNLFSDPASVAFWYYPTEDSSDVIMSEAWSIRQRLGQANEAGLWFSSGHTGTDGVWRTNDTTPDISNNQWNHIVVTYDGSSLTNDPVFYINGQVATGFTEITAPTGTPSTGIGIDTGIGASAAGAAPVRARIDDVRFYKRILSSNEAQALYQTGNLPDNSLVGHWMLDETSGTDAIDSSAYGNDGTMDGSMNATNDSINAVIGTGLDFDSTDDRISITDPGTNSIFDFDDGDQITLSTWIYPNDIAGPYTNILGKGNGPAQTNYYLEIVGDDLVFFYRDTGGSYQQYQANDVLSANIWQHVAVTYTFGTGSTARLYLNGYEVPGSWSIGDGNTTPVQNDNDVYIGSLGSNQYFDGGIDDARIYNRILTASEIQALYEGGDSVQTDLIGHWRLDDTNTTAIDSSISGRNGTMEAGLDGATDSVGGVIDAALDFTPNNTINLGDFDLPDNFTISTWFNADTLGGAWEAIVMRQNNYGIELRGSNIHMRVGGTWSNDVTTNTLTTNRWYHAVLAYNGTTDTLTGYLDGVPLGTNTSTFTNTNDNTYIGSWGGFQEYFDGQIDDTRFYGRTLSASEVEALYDEGVQIGISDGLIGYWRLDETTGTTAFDSSGNELNGNLLGGMDATNDSVEGVINGAYEFEGTPTNLRVDVPYNALLNTTDTTYAAWFRVDEFDAQPALNIMHQELTSTQRMSLNVDLPENALRCSIGNNAGQEVQGLDNSIEAGIWYHGACVHDTVNDTLTLYLNGVQIDTSSTTLNPDKTGTVFTIGYRNRNNGSFVNDYFNGDIDDVRLYGRVLSPTELQVLANCTGPGEQFYNFTDDVQQWCDAVASPRNMATPASGSGGCGGQVEGSMNYNATTNTYRFCDGNGWVNIGK